MLSIPDAWKVALRTSGGRPAVVVQIDPDASTSFYFASANARDLGYPDSVRGLTPLAAKIDARTRKPQVGGFSVDFADDGALRRLNRDYRLKGKRVIVKLGYAGLAYASYQPLARGVIQDVIPGTGKTMMQLRATDAFSLVADRNITGRWRARHPLDVINDILVDEIGLPSDLIDTSTIDKAAAVNSSFAHYVVNRTALDEDDRTVSTPQSGLKLIDEIGALLNGSLIPTEDGKIAFKRYDHTAAAVAAWGTSIVRDLRVKEVHGNLYNKFSMLMGWINLGAGNYSPDNPRNASENGPAGGEFRYQFDLQDSDSIAAHAYPDLTEGIFADGSSTKWVGMETILGAAMTSGQTTMECTALALPGFCGSLGQGDAAYALFALSAGNPGYFRVGSEVVKVTAVTFGSHTDGETLGPDDGEDGGEYQSSLTGSGNAATGTHQPGPGSGHADVLTASYTVVRGMFGTTAEAHPVSHHVVDITIGVNVALDTVGRFGNGAAVVEVDVPLSEHFVQLVDMVTLAHEAFSGYGLDGVTASTKWEVTGKQVTPLGPNAGITFTLTQAPTPPSFTQGWTWWGNRSKSYGPVADSVWADWWTTVTPHGPLNRTVEMLRRGDVIQAHVVSGCTVTSPSALLILIAEGVVVGPGAIRRKAGAMSRTYSVPASKDSYIYFDAATGLYTRRSVANGATAPTAGPTEAYLAKVVSGASAVTSITDTATRFALLAAKLDPAAVWAGMLGFGDGSDGDVTITGTTTLTATKQYRNLTIASGGVLKPDGFIVRVRGTLTLQGTAVIHVDGVAGAAGGAATSNVGGAKGDGGNGGGRGTGAVLPKGQNGANGNAGGAGHLTAPTAGGAGAAAGAVASGFFNDAAAALAGGTGARGGDGNGDGASDAAGGAAGAGGTTTASVAVPPSHSFVRGQTVVEDGVSRSAGPAGGGGSGGGGADISGTSSTQGGGGGGAGGGGSAGTLLLLARFIVRTGWTGRLSANGGAGGQGGSGHDIDLLGGDGFGGAGGGGGGGAGGVVGVGCQTVDDSAALAAGLAASGGAAGAAGAIGSTINYTASAAGTAGVTRLWQA